MGVSSSNTNKKLELKYLHAVQSADLRKVKKYLKKDSTLINCWCYDVKLLADLADHEKLNQVKLTVASNNSTVNPINNPQVKIDPYKLNQNPKYNPLNTNQLVPLTALMIAAQLGHASIHSALLEHGADIQRQAEDGRNALMIAATHGNTRIIQELLQHVAFLRKINTNQNKIEGDFDPLLDCRDELGQTALLRASSMGHSHIIELLIAAGANVNITDHIDGMSALAWASEHGPSTIVKLLITHGANVNQKNHQGQTPLIRAASKDYAYSDRFNSSMVSKNVFVDVEENEMKLHSASSPSVVVDTLISGGADVNAKNHDGYTALMVAAWQGHSLVVDALIRASADVNMQAEKGQTALMVAAGQSHSRIAELLITLGANVNICDEKGETALMKAACKGDTYVVDCLIRCGANINAKDNIYGNSVLIWAVLHINSSIVESLLRAGADVNTTNHKGESALISAVKKGHSYTTGCLISAGADTNITDNINGQSALMFAVEIASESLVELLLDHGARVNHKSHSEQTALTLALNHKQQSIIEFLVSAGANINFPYKGTTTSYEWAAKDPNLRAAMDRGIANREKWEHRAKKVLPQLNYAMLGALKQRNNQANSSSVSNVGHSNESNNSSATTAPKAKSNSNPQEKPEKVESVSEIPPDPAETSEDISGERQTRGSGPQLLRSDSDFVASSDLSSANSPLFNAVSVASWRVAHVLSWLRLIGLPQYTSIFADNSVDGELLLDLTENLLIEEMKMERKIHRMKILKEIKKLHNTAGTNNDKLGPELSDIKSNSTPRIRRLSESIGSNNFSNNQSLSTSNTAVTGPNLSQNHSNAMNYNNVSNQPGFTTSISVPLPNPNNKNNYNHDNNSNTNLESNHNVNLPSYINAASSGSEKPAFFSKLDFNLDDMLSNSNADNSSYYDNNSNTNNNNNGGLPLPLFSGDFVNSVELIHPQLGRFQPNLDIFNNLTAQNSSSANSNSSNHSNNHNNLSAGPSGGSGRAVRQNLAHLVSAHPYDNPLQSSDFEDFHSKAARISTASSPARLHSANSPNPNSTKNSQNNNSGLPVHSTVMNPKVSLGIIPEPRKIPYSELELEREIGRGQFGTVYLARWRGAVVAVKKLHAQDLSEEQFSHFVREAGLMEMLGNHPNIVRFCGICVDKPNVAIVTQYFSLGSVRDLLIKYKPVKNLDIYTILCMAHDVAAGVRHLHLEGVIHRDLAARNLLVDSNMNVKISDFGMSRLKAVQNPSNSGYTHSNIGPLKWMAPESITKHEYSEKSDSFSFGICLWELLSAGEPYQGQFDLEVAVAVVQSEDYRPKLPESCPAPLAQLIRQCWRADKNQRPDFNFIAKQLQTMKDYYKKQRSSNNGNTGNNNGLYINTELDIEAVKGVQAKFTRELSDGIVCNNNSTINVNPAASVVVNSNSTAETQEFWKDFPLE
jgi:ankyrin repeat protein/serine/threonine protein kinase